MESKLYLLLFLLLCYFSNAQIKIPETLTDDYLSNFIAYDFKSAPAGEATYIVEKAIFFDDLEQLIPQDKVSEYRLNSDFTIDKMYIDEQQFVRVVVYKKSTPEEKAIKDQQLEKQKQKDPNEFAGTYPKPFELVDIENNRHTLESLKGKVVVLNYWFIGCKPCEEEMPALNKLVERYKDKDVVFLGLTYNKPDEIREFLKVKDFKFTIVPEAYQLIQDYNVMGYPTHMLIDKTLLIRYMGMLPDFVLYDKMSEAIDILLAQN